MGKKLSPAEIAQLPYRPNVGVMLVNEAGKIWVGQRIDSVAEAWQMPQGGIDQGEDPRAAALRELQEETGVSADMVTIEAELPEWLRYDLPEHLVHKLWKGRWRGQEQKWFLMRFNGADSDIRIDTKDPEFAAWLWCDADELVSRIVPFKRDVYAQVLAHFGSHL